jgi:hypothetical protein
MSWTALNENWHSGPGFLIRDPRDLAIVDAFSRTDRSFLWRFAGFPAMEAIDAPA